MRDLDFSGFANRPPLAKILKIPPKVQSVYSLTQHVWHGESDDARRDSKKKNKVRLETLDELYIDPVRSYLNRIFETVAEGRGQGFWVQAEFGVGKSHLLAATAVLAVGGPAAWDRAKQREDEEKKAGPGARIDNLWRKKLEKKKLFPIVFSLEGSGGGHERKLEDFILDEAQATFGIREGKPLAVYPEEHLARLFMRDHQKAFKDDLRAFLADKRLMHGLPKYDYDELLDSLRRPESQRDSGRVLWAFYRHKNLAPNVPTERGERLGRAVRDILDAGYSGVFIAIDEMSEYLRRSHFTSDDEDCLLTLSSTLAQAQGLPIWILVAAQAAHTNPKKIIGPDRLREELLEHKAERFRDIVVQRTRQIVDPAAVKVYYDGYRKLIPWVKASDRDVFDRSFPFPPDALTVLRDISKKLTGTRSTISFLHRALLNAAKENVNELIPLWRVFDDLMTYNEKPSASSSRAISIRSGFRGEVAALEAAQATLSRITDGHLARPQNRSRAERILNTLFLYHLAGVAGLTKEQILDAVTDLKANEDQLDAQLGHYETILEEMRSKLRNQIRCQKGRYEFIPKETSQYDDLASRATERLKSDRQLLWQKIDRLMVLAEKDAPSPFSGVVPEEDGRLLGLKLTSWHGQERGGRVTAIDVSNPHAGLPEVDTHGNEDDFVAVLCRRPMTAAAVDKVLKRTKDPRVVVWAPAEPTKEEEATLAGVLAHLTVAEEHKDSQFEKEARREFKKDVQRAYTVMQGIYTRGVAKTIRKTPSISPVGGVEGMLGTMAEEALDSCYQSRKIDFGNRKFDTQGAVKLINGLVKRGLAVGEGDQLWSAVENFAGPLGLVRPELPNRLDPSASEFYQAIRKRVQERGGAGIEVRTVYNWFTGYNQEDGLESPGLTRRMVDVYLLCLAQQGVIRISSGKRGEWIDRSTIANIDFKPETLRNLGRIELPRALEDWQVFCPYLETLVGYAEGTLPTKYDKASAEEALRLLWENHWPELAEIQRVEQELAGLSTALGSTGKHPFDDLLLYWIEFAQEERPDPYSEKEVFDALRRAVIKVSEVDEVEKLDAVCLTRFKTNHQRLKELRDSFAKTSLLLVRAAKLASAPLPEGKQYRPIERAQADVKKELEKAEELILSPDTVTTRLVPRLNQLEADYVPAYLDELVRLDSLQAELEGIAAELEKSPEYEVLNDFSSDVTEAETRRQQCRDALADLPPRLRRTPEDREVAEAEVKREARIKDTRGEDISFRRLVQICRARQEIAAELPAVAKDALSAFAGFLKSPGVVGLLGAVKNPSVGLAEILSANTDKEVAEILLTLPKPDRKTLAKELKATLGGKTAKVVTIGTFTPKTIVLWEKTDIDTVVEEFKDYLKGQWRDGQYIQIER